VLDPRPSDDEFNVHTGYACTLKFPVPLGEALNGTLAQCKVSLRFELHFNETDPYALRKVTCAPPRRRALSVICFESARRACHWNSVLCTKLTRFSRSSHKVSTKTLRLHELASSGMQQAATVGFDFFHTCSIDVAVCGILLGFSEWAERPRLDSVRRLSVATVMTPIKRRLTLDKSSAAGDRYAACAEPSPGVGFHADVHADVLETSGIILLPDEDPMGSRPTRARSNSKGKGPQQPEMVAPHLDEETFGDMSLEELAIVVGFLGHSVETTLHALAKSLTGVRLGSNGPVQEVCQEILHHCCRSCGPSSLSSTFGAPRCGASSQCMHDTHTFAFMRCRLPCTLRMLRTWSQVQYRQSKKSCTLGSPRLKSFRRLCPM
jgi:hypothetical protein